MSLGKRTNKRMKERKWWKRENDEKEDKSVRKKVEMKPHFKINAGLWLAERKHYCSCWFYFFKLRQLQYPKGTEACHSLWCPWMALL